jgi:hypothetical protein
MPTEMGCFGGIMPILSESISPTVKIFDYISVYYQFSPCFNDIGTEFAIQVTASSSNKMILRRFSNNVMSLIVKEDV